MGFWDNIHKVSRMADERLKRAKFVPTEMPAWVTEEGFHAYEVVIGGVVYGKVFQAREHTFKKAGRLRYGDKYVKRWRFEPCPGSRMYYDTRKNAAHMLVEQYIQKTEKTEEGD